MSIVDDLVHTVNGTKFTRATGWKVIAICIAPEKRRALSAEMAKMQRYTSPEGRLPYRFLTLMVHRAIVGTWR